MSYTIDELWAEPIDISLSKPIFLMIDDNLGLKNRSNKVEYDLVKRAKKSWDYYYYNAVTETTLSLINYLKFQFGCYLINKYSDSMNKYGWMYSRNRSKYTSKLCMNAYNLLESGRTIRWRLF